MSEVQYDGHGKIRKIKAACDETLEVKWFMRDHSILKSVYTCPPQVTVQARQSARPCGCDPAASYMSEGCRERGSCRYDDRDDRVSDR